MVSSIKKEMKTIFCKVQYNKIDHPQYIKRLTKLYERIDFDTFWNCFISFLKVPLTMAQQHLYIINTLEFCAKFVVSFYSTSENESMEPMSPFANKLFKFLLSHHSAKDKAVRFRICHFLNILLNSMGDDAFIDDNLCDQITVTMMDRLLDKSPKVRAQAVFALHRLQDPSDEQCPVIKMYVFHVSKDPSAEVRKAVLSCMGKNQKTLQAVLIRTRDIDDSVRKMAFEFISKITVRSLTIEQRERLLKDGLKDRSENVRKCVSNVLLPTWLRCYKGEYLNLVHALDAGIGTETATLALQVLFKDANLKNLLEQVPIDKDTRLIPLTNISNENVLFWKCVIKHLQYHSYTEELELIIPELSGFCTYIYDYMTLISSKSYEVWEKECHKFILLQLFEISTTYDLADEVGRKKLNELMVDALMSDHCYDKIIECTVNHLAKVIPDTNNMLNIIANIISEIRLPSCENLDTEQVTVEQQQEKNMQKARLKVDILELEEELYQAVKEENFLEADSIKEKIKVLKEEITQLSKIPEVVIVDDMREEKNDSITMIKCLNILYFAMQSIHTLTPTLKSLMSLVLNSLDHPDDNVHVLALKLLSTYCILDKELAKKHIMIFFYQFSYEQENQENWIVALKAIFDLLLIYGLEYFENLQIQEENSENKSEKSRLLYTHEDSIVSINKRIDIEKGPCNFIKILIGLLNNANQDMRTIATEGFCKLLLNQRISSSTLISRLIILAYNKANIDDIYLRQCLSVFFEHFIVRVPEAQEMLESAYFPTLRALCDAPDVSPLREIDIYHVSKFILNLTSRGYQKTEVQTFCTHNNLAFAILAEILNSESNIDKDILIKSLTNLHIQIEDAPSKQNLQEAIENVTNMVKHSDRRLLKYIQQFKQKLEAPEIMEVVEENSGSDSEN
ncbi:Condensin complex subunit 3 [Camponotus floridanus]|uniref:Condensin complex subunit 3 n=1 Tax=Camponotus floridanus TaxID=104421 RepID=E2AIZ3_CAMFO|nr:condensin complex subunit 3 [Camponotus floridanus]EFN66582.1 Condensin complex subunit 3 [Camponotus floridanus]